MNISYEKIRKILYIQYKPFGDVLCNTGVLPFIKDAFPHAALDYLVCHPCQQILTKNPHIDELIIFKDQKGPAYIWNRLRLYFRLYRRKYDLVIDQMCGTGSAQMTLFSGAKYRLGYQDSRRRQVYNILAERGEQRYSAALKFDLLKPLGIQEQAYRMEYDIKAESEAFIDKWLVSAGLDQKPLICVAPGSKAEFKKWRPEYFAQLCDFIIETTDYTVILLWADYEWGDVQKVVESMKHKAIVAPRTDLNQGTALLKQVDLLICNDVALNHLSAVTRTPSLAFFGATSPVNWSPTSDPQHYYLWHPDRYQKGDSSFGISVENAIEKLQDILKEIALTR